MRQKAGKITQEFYDQLPTVSHKLTLFMYDRAYDKNDIAKALDMPQSTLSDRFKMNSWTPGDIRNLNQKITNKYCININL